MTAQLERKVRQLDNDVSSLYEALARIELKQGRHDTRFDEIDEDLNTLTTDVSTLGNQMSEVLDILRAR